MERLLNECINCKMQFESSEHLNKHLEKFCSKSKFAGDLDQLYEQKLRERNIQQNQQQDHKQGQNQWKGRTEFRPAIYQDLKYQIAEDDLMKELEKKVELNRRDEIEDEIEKIKSKRQNVRLEKQKDEDLLYQMIKNEEAEKEQLIKDRMVKDQIKRQIQDLEKQKLDEMMYDKQREFENIRDKKERLRLQEQELQDEINRISDENKQMNQMRQEELERMEGMTKNLRKNVDNNKAVNTELLEQKAQMIARLRMQREQLEQQRDELNNKKLQKHNVLINNAQNMLGDMKQLRDYNIEQMKKDLQSDQHRLNRLKNMKDEPYLGLDTAEVEDQQNTDGVEHIRGIVDNQNKLHKNEPIRLQENLKVINDRLENIDRNSINSLNQSRYSNFNNDKPNQNNRSLQDINRIPTGKQQNNKQYHYNHNNHNHNHNHQQQPQPQQYNNQNNNNRQQCAICEHNRHEQHNRWGQQTGNSFRFQGKLGSNPMMNSGVNQMAGLQAANTNHYEIFNQKNDFFLQNVTRNQQLSKEESTILNLNAFEVDELRILDKLKPGTELYRFKVEQYKEQSQTRSEMVKLVQEQRLQQMRREFEKQRREEDRQYYNQKWIDDQRKQILQQKMYSENNQMDQRGDGYNEQMVIHFDYGIFLPKDTEFVQLVFGLYQQGQQVYQPILIEPKISEVQNADYNQALIGESHLIYDLQPNQDAMLIVEVQFPPSENLQYNVDKTVSYGWTMLDLFDFRGNLKRGRFRLPIYNGPTDTNIIAEDVKYLNRIPFSEIYVRVTYPDDNQYRQKSIDPGQTSGQYNIPFIHGQGQPNQFPYQNQQLVQNPAIINNTVSNQQTQQQQPYTTTMDTSVSQSNIDQQLGKKSTVESKLPEIRQTKVDLQ